MSLVLDSCLLVAALTREVDTDFAQATLTRSSGRLRLGPAVLPIEVASALRRKERAGLITASEVDRALALLAVQAIGLAAPETEEQLRDVVGLSRGWNLTPYDAAYLALAMQEQAELATLDGCLATAARALNVTVHCPR